MYHFKQDEVNLLIENNIPVILEGESGSGKSTILINAAKKAGVPYSFIAGTRQTTVSHIIGFMNVNGGYSSTPFRKAYEEGHYFNIDEIDAMDNNVLLIFNSLENDIMYFPDGYSEPPHKNFRLMATANPQDQHSSYVGRSKIDAATLDRFDQISVERDSNLEKSIVDFETMTTMRIARECLSDSNSSIAISMRDSIRYMKRMKLGIHDGYVKKIMKGNDIAYDKFLMEMTCRPEFRTSQNCSTVSDLVEFLDFRANSTGE